ncbi:MAG: hypothetical protein IJ131_01545 [Eggerthellaceae bacterium]|nr:hypothetical protein [Eggerthellaceae bacterium]
MVVALLIVLDSVVFVLVACVIRDCALFTASIAAWLFDIIASLAFMTSVFRAE